MRELYQEHPASYTSGGADTVRRFAMGTSGYDVPQRRERTSHHSYPHVRNLDDATAVELLEHDISLSGGDVDLIVHGLYLSSSSSLRRTKSSDSEHDPLDESEHITRYISTLRSLAEEAHIAGRPQMYLAETSVANFCPRTRFTPEQTRPAIDVLRQILEDRQFPEVQTYAIATLPEAPYPLSTVWEHGYDPSAMNIFCSQMVEWGVEHVRISGMFLGGMVIDRDDTSSAGGMGFSYSPIYRRRIRNSYAESLSVSDHVPNVASVIHLNGCVGVVIDSCVQAGIQVDFRATLPEISPDVEDLVDGVFDGIPVMIDSGSYRFAQFAPMIEW